MTGTRERDFIFRWQNPGGISCKCRLRLYFERSEGFATVIVSELPYHASGAISFLERFAIANDAENPIATACKQLNLDLQKTIWIEHCPALGYPRSDDYYRLTLCLGSVRRQAISQEEVEQFIGKLI